MSANRDREEEIFDAARELATDERAAYLAERCGQDADLRQRIEGMIEADAAAGEFFKTRDAPSPTVIVAEASLSPSIEKAGDRIGRYKLLQQIGEGGMGLVYMAEQDQPVRRSVALKIIKLGMDTRQVVARFEAERQALAMMNHPHIAKVFDAGATDSGRPYFVMELVRGIPITEYCDKSFLPTRQRLDLFILVCQAVQHAHQKGVIHRDLKPSNILVTLNDGVPWPMIIDFGIAKATHQRLTEKTLFTHFAQMIGTPAYMSPEQAEMSKLDVDTRTDIYALGVLLYELLTGTTPFSTKELLSLGYREMQRTIAEREPPRLSTRLSTMANEERTVVAKNRSVDVSALAKLFRGDLDWIAMKCLEKDRARRYETANALAADIRRHLDCEPVVARPPSRWYEFQKTVRRHKFGFAAAGAVIMALAIGLGVSTWQFVHKNRAYHRASAAEREQSRLRQQAEASQKKSETEAAKATAISDFLQQLLRSANPEALKGSEYTVRQLLDDFSAALANQLKDQPEVEAAVRATIGRAYFRLGMTDKALEHQERALTLGRRIFGEQTEPVAESLVDCAWTCFEQMQYAKGESYAREALEIYRKRGTAGQPVIYGLWAWQRMLITQSRFAEVEAIMEEALTIARQSPTIEFPDIASMIHGLADVKNIQSQHAEAESLALKAVAMHRRLHGAEHPETGWALVTVGVALRGQQKLADAEAALREALRIFRKYHSSRHNSVDAAMNELKLVFEARRDFAAVEALYREILAGQRAKLGNNSPAVAETLNNFGIVLLRAGKRPEAELLFQEAEAVFRADLALRRQRFGDVHREVEVALLALAQSLQQAGKLAEAEAVCREELAMERKLSGDEHPFVANSLHTLSTVLRDSGKLPEAEATAREALEIREKGRGNEHTDVAQTLHLLAWNLNLQGKHIEAEALSRREVAMWRKLLDNEHPNVAWALGDLSIFLRDQGKLADAETTIRDALAIRQKRSGNTPPPAVDHLTLLGELLRAQGKLAEVISMYREAAQRGGAPELNQFAWLLATSPDANLRDGTNAVIFAEKAVEATNRKNVRYLDTLAAAHAETGQFANAVSAQQEAIGLSQNEQERKDLASRLKLYDSNLPYRDHGSLAETTLVLLDAGKYVEAEPLARECLAIRELQIPDDWRTFNTRSMLGGALLGQKKYAQAEPFLLTGYEGMKQREKTIPLIGKVRIREALRRLSQLHEATGQPGKAAEWNKKLAEFDQADAEKQVATPKPQSKSQP